MNVLILLMNTYAVWLISSKHSKKSDHIHLLFQLVNIVSPIVILKTQSISKTAGLGRSCWSAVISGLKNDI